MELTQGKVVKWVNKSDKQIVFLVTDDNKTGVVVHSDSLLSVGTIVNLLDYTDLQSFIGTVHISSNAV